MSDEANGDPVAVEAFAVVGRGDRVTRWVCLVCCGPSRDQTVDTGDPDVGFHVTSPLNRASIAEHGLDSRRMGDAPGIAGSRLVPELDGIFLSRTQWEAKWFAGFKAPVDIWAVSLAGIELEDGPNGYQFTRSPIPPSRVRRIQADDSYRLEHRSIPSSEM